MIIPARFIVIDNRQTHLDALCDAFDALRSPCRAVLFDPEEDIEEGLFEGARAIFCDLHLLEGQSGSSDNALFANIVGLLGVGVPTSGMPYVLCLWTEHDEKLEAFQQYLQQSLCEANGHIEPLTVISLPKNDFMNDLDTGTVQDPAVLREAVQSKLATTPQLAAILAWETSADRALQNTLTALAATARQLEPQLPLSTALDALLSNLAVGAAGKPRALENPQAAIGAALAPILADRVGHAQRESNPVWNNAITKIEGVSDLEVEPAATILTMVHFALEPKPSSLEWGAVHAVPDEYIDTHFKLNHGCSFEDYALGLGFRKNNNADVPKGSKLRLIRVGAACDYAQKNKGPVPMTLALEVPQSGWGTSKRKNSKKQEFIWSSPPFKNSDGQISFLICNMRYQHHYTAPVAEKFLPLYRLREPLLMQLINRISTYTARPGILDLEIK